MSTLGGSAVTLLDIAKATDPNGQPAKIVEILSQSNELLQDATFMECNDGDSHQVSIRTGLPSGTWRRYNEGVAPSKGTTAQVRAQTGMLEANSIIDRALAEKGGQLQANRANQSIATVMGLGQQMEAAFIYEDERTNPGRITGLAPHYASVSTATAQSAENVIDAGGTGSDNTSVWLVCWGPLGVTGLIPAGGKIGMQREDKGIVSVADSTGVAGSTFDAYREWFCWKVGIAVVDWRQAGRICNIDVSNLEAESSQADLIAYMIELSEHIYNKNLGRCAWYVNRKVRKMLRVQQYRAVKAGGGITYENIEGKTVMMFDGIPVRLTDSILNTEARLT